MPATHARRPASRPSGSSCAPATCRVLATRPPPQACLPRAAQRPSHTGPKGPPAPAASHQWLPCQCTCRPTQSHVAARTAPRRP
eukprot:10556387-Lingulodinium_polyedra.AAC.1